MSQRPQLLLIVVIVVIAMGIYQILQGLGYMDIGPFHPGLEKPSGMDQALWDLAMTIAGGVLIIIGLLSLFIALLVYNGSRVGRIILIVVLIFSVIGGVLNFPVGLFILVLSIVLLYILFRPDVKQFFRA